MQSGPFRDGYANNVLYNNKRGRHHGQHSSQWGFQIGTNLCNGISCP